jgi:hypothetical protein
LARSSFPLLLVACASAPPPDPAEQTAPPANDPAPTIAPPAPALSEAERATFVALAAECGGVLDEATVHPLGQSSGPSFPEGEVTGPIQVDIARDVGFARLGAFVAAFVPHGAGVRMVVGQGTFFLSGEGELDSIPLATGADPSCGGWSVHVDGRRVRVRAGAVTWPWLDVGELRDKARDLDGVEAPFVLELNATAETPAEVAVFAAATIACAVGGDAPPILLLGDNACPSAQAAER